jgi:hypothetical protein
MRPPDPRVFFDGGRVKVPYKLHTELVGLRNHGDAEAELLAWYADVAEAWTHGAHRTDEPGAEMFAFWRARYTERWPPMKAKPTEKPRPAWASPRK